MDLIKTIEQEEIKRLNRKIPEFAPGDTISVEILRGGQTQTLSVTLGTRPSNL